MISRTIIMEHFSINNMTDLTNKYGLQFNIALFTGNILGLIISLSVTPCFVNTFSIISATAFFNLIMTYRSLKYLILTEFNFQRLAIFCEEYINTTNILTPQEVAKKERLFYNKYKNIHFCSETPDYIVKTDNHTKAVNLIDLFRDRNFFVTFRRRTIGKYNFFTNLSVNADNNDIFIAFLFTIRLAHLYEKTKESILKCYEENLSYIDSLDRKQMFEKMKLVGWNLQFGLMEEKYARYHMLFKNI
jgi:hypothetical protein